MRTFKISFNKVQLDVERFAADFSKIQKSAQVWAQYTQNVEKMISNLASPFEKLVFEDRAVTYFKDSFADLQVGLKRHEDAHILVSATLPRLGWYLSGSEPCTLSLKLANAVRKENWEKVDQLVMEHLPEYKIDALKGWLAQETVPDYCINRLCIFLKHHNGGNYEEATYLGIPLIDELAAHLYRGKVFTTKRGKKGAQSKPELAYQSANGPDLKNYCKAFVQAFGSLQLDCDPKSLGNENYWNRHAILHGMMRRAMGQKDSAKCLMAISFLIHARQEAEVST